MSPTRRRIELVQRRQLGMLRQLGLRARSAPVALLGERLVEARAIDRDAVLGRELDRQVDRKAVRVVELERDAPGSNGASGGRSSRRPADDARLVRGQRDQRLLEQLGPGLERPRELGLLARDHAAGSRRAAHEVRVGARP